MSATDTKPDTPPAAIAVESIQLGIEGMHCASCVARVEHELGSVPGVVDASVSLGSEEARVTHAPGGVSVVRLEQAVERAGYHAHEKAGQPEEDDFARRDRDRAREYAGMMRSVSSGTGSSTVMGSGARSASGMMRFDHRREALGGTT